MLENIFFLGFLRTHPIIQRGRIREFMQSALKLPIET
jgi:hypothetical protein